MPETKGRTLEEISESFGGPPVPRDQVGLEREKEDRVEAERREAEIV